MKMLKAAATAALMMAAMSASADTSHFDVSVGIGMTDYDVYSNQFSATDRTTSFQVGAGFQVLDNVKVEARYMDLGEFSKRKGNWNVKADNKAVAVGVVLEAPMASISDRATFFLRADAVHLMTDVKATNGVTSASDDSSDIVPAVGLGFMYQVNPTLKGRLQYERIFADLDARGLSADSDIDQISVSLHKNL